MPLPQVVAVKYNLYTLACYELLKRLEALYSATQEDLRHDYVKCLQYFDKMLLIFFQTASSTTLVQAVHEFGDLLYGIIGLVRGSNKPATTVFEDLIEAIRKQASSWDYYYDLQRVHAQGRELASRFFADSLDPETQNRLSIVGNLLVDYATPDTDHIVSLSPHLAPLAYFPRSNDLRLHFIFEHDLTLYLAYPFLFLHEYTAHVYANDNSQNERFNDGWMLHAAAAFLQRQWSKVDALGLGADQGGIFYEQLYHKLNPIPRRACGFARDFDAWLSDASLPNKFTQLTYELAAFRPGPGEKEYWPTQFINALEREFRIDVRRQRLLSIIYASKNIRQLMASLS